MSHKIVTAAILIIGDEILSGRTQDTNTSTIATFLGDRGIEVRETRTVPDIEDEIVAALNALRDRFDYVFTTGGIGPTHDDITADAVAAAFGVGIDYHPEAYALLEAHYEKMTKERGGEVVEFTEARKRMARIPDGAALIDNPISKAPGFNIGNVFVMAGIPMIMKTMLQSLEPLLDGGSKVVSLTVGAGLAEGQMAEALAEIQGHYQGLTLGSYPFLKDGKYGANFVIRSREAGDVAAAGEELRAVIRDKGATPIEQD